MTNHPSLEVLRHLLASIDLSDVKEEKLTEKERKDYCANISNVFPTLKKDLEKLMHEQLLFGHNHVANWEQLMFSRGTFNGFALALDLWKKASEEHDANIKPEDDPTDKNSPIAEV